jgi:bifunctional DNase/RNase
MLKEKRLSLLATIGLWLVASIWLCGETMADGFTPVALEQKELLEVKVHQLLKDPTSKQPVVFLVDSLEERALLIWISFFEADAIHSEMQGIKHRRPLTHDLLERIIQKVNGKIHRIVITHIEEGIFYATIVLEKGDTFLEIDARPSDSIVMALKFKAPIFVSKDLFKEMAIPLDGQEEIEKQYGLTIQDLTPSLVQVFSFPETHGVLVSDVRKGSDAEKDGIKRGDIFVEVGGRAVEDVTIMKDALATTKTPVEATIFRKAHFLKITLHPK